MPTLPESSMRTLSVKEPPPVLVKKVRAESAVEVPGSVRMACIWAVLMSSVVLASVLKRMPPPIPAAAVPEVIELIDRRLVAVSVAVLAC